MQYGMAIDLKKCMGCQTCSISCRLANNLPSGMWWNRVITEDGEFVDTVGGTYPNNTMRQIPIACQHCANPECTKVCPTGATYKDEETGIVMQDSENCIGCKTCLSACPYEGVRTLLEGEPKWAVEHAVGEADAPVHQADTMEKCVLCANRVSRDAQPKCVEACPGRARFFGDISDPESEVSKLIASGETMQLLSSEGTSPSIYYLV